MSINIKKNVNLAPLTTFRIGGPAKFFCEVKNEHELEEAVKYAKDNSLAAFIMGGGSNILFSDKGFDGLVIRVRESNEGKPIVKMHMENGDYFLECWAGEKLSNMVKLAKDSSLSGMEWATGIPGSIGGAVRGNAGTPWGTISDNVSLVKVLDLRDLGHDDYVPPECQFEYRNSIFKKDDNLVVVSVRLKLKRGDPVEIEKKMEEITAKRSGKQPQGMSPGSFFENPRVEDKEIIEKFEKDTGAKSLEGKVPAGWLIEEAGFLGKKIGQAKVSEEHGNFVINLGGAKAEDVVMLAGVIKQKVRCCFGIELKEEIKYVGFNNN